MSQPYFDPDAGADHAGALLERVRDALARARRCASSVAIARRSSAGRLRANRWRSPNTVGSSPTIPANW